MAETIISPGVFTRENDLSFLPQGVGAIGAAFVGPTMKGPAFVPTLIRNGFQDFIRKFGDQHPETYVPFAIKEYLRNAGVVTVVRVLAGGGYTYGGSTRPIAYITTDSTKKEIIGVLVPSRQATAGTEVNPSSIDLGESSMLNVAGGAATYSDTISLVLSGSNVNVHDDAISFPAANKINTSFDSTNSNYVTKTLGTDANNNKSGANSWLGGKPAFSYVQFDSFRDPDTGDILSPSESIQLITGSVEAVFTSSFVEGYDHAKTPFITSGFLDVYPNTTTVDLFKFHTIADGDNTNSEYKVSIANLREVADIEGIEQYCTFTVQIRSYGDTDKSPIILEEFSNCDLDPNSPNFISRRIGDRYQEYSSAFGKVVTKGDYPNISEFVRVEVAEGVNEGSYSPKYEPRGFGKVSDTIIPAYEAEVQYTLPAYVSASVQEIGGTYNTKAYLGWDFTNINNSNWIKSTPRSGSATADTHLNKGAKFNVDQLNMHPSASAAYSGALSASVSLTGDAGPRAIDLKFTVPFQGGSDGIDPAKIRFSGANLADNNAFGFDLSSTNAAGYTGYKKALDILSNQDEYDINMLVLPGVIKQLHASVTDAANVMAEDRGDTFYVMDLAIEESTVANAVNEANGLDSNYAAVYYPWVKVLDTSRNKPIFVPPSVIVPAAIAASDRIGAEWFAPAGLNRGVLGTVLEAKNRLNQAERDSLYEGRVNPIATFPATGVCIWGQKTLQVRPTALDRINVRRLLITLKKFIASSSKFLVFEQNTLQTRNRFLNIVNPYLESVQQRQGLFAFRVVMDETNNTPTEIDRNRLIGAIYLQPTKTAEFIVLDFNVLPTGATFPA
tara:strand:- start:641 stop:3160 length:2520 start_codon:yes stop_codon:yes gene_type:complete